MCSSYLTQKNGSRSSSSPGRPIVAGRRAPAGGGAGPRCLPPMLRNICGRGAARLAGPRRAAASSFGRAASVGQPDDGGNGWKKSRQILVNVLKAWKYRLSAIETAGSLFTRTGRIVVVGVIVVGVVKIMYEERIRSEETVDAASGYERARARVLNVDYLDAVGVKMMRRRRRRRRPKRRSERFAAAGVSSSMMVQSYSFERV
ncbi:uncharacterized protein LOC104582579 isoform X1 [Brachypodium distachyon]|uniref:Uncharacterized protein n=1 Tax=Brachypodium distachyon TaxID=15368 RepID=A0A0Q3QT10_BRADI|nr:uncharacterized protein LOC104582579 isoform X1 [Brachypodium distachyon]KQK04634.1 hypothetical protein BRADI_2g14801v3 [Brachypodium distachyon]|eukprot:XP_010230971.1 uncharacterized protein LOC104582579 isoform X1 [Brachypodium distachyon]